MASDFLLTKLVSLREEDFLTAIFAHLLRHDEQFRVKYLKMLGVQSVNEFEITTWRSYGPNLDNRPDIVLSNNRDTIIFQENKINSPEGRNQLRRYSERLANCNEKNRVLIYMSKNQPELRLKKNNYRIRPRFLNWESITPFLRSKKPKATQWLRAELYDFLFERGMTMPESINIRSLMHHWKRFEPQLKALLNIIDDSISKIKEKCDAKKYKCTVDSESDGLGFYVSRKTGKLKKFMPSSMWIWGGIYRYDEENEAYVALGIGWSRKYSENIGNKIRSYLKNNNFEPWDKEYDEYYSEETLSKLIGGATDFNLQSKLISKWIKDRSKLAIKALDRIENDW